jgi:hypothetical protein
MPFEPVHARPFVDGNYVRYTKVPKGYQLRLLIWWRDVEQIGLVEGDACRWFIDKAEKAVAFCHDPEGNYGTMLRKQSPGSRNRKNHGPNPRAEIVIPAGIAAMLMSWADMGAHRKRYQAITTIDREAKRIEFRLGEYIANGTK